MALKDRTTKRSFHPDVRIIILIKEPTFNYAGIVSTSPVWLEIKNWRDVSTTCSLGRTNSATITLSNKGDRYFNKARQLPTTYKRQKGVIRYLEDVFDISELRERNLERRQEFFEAEKKQAYLSSRYGKYFNVLDNGNYSSVNILPKTRKEEYSQYEFLPLDIEKMKRVWIDYKNRDDEWAAAFTGYISALSTVYNPGQSSIVSLDCRGTLGHLETSEIIIKEGVEPQNEPYQKGEFSSVGFSTLTNNFAKMDGDEIIRTTVNLAQDSYCYNYGSVSDKKPKHYFYQERFWQTKGCVYMPDDRRYKETLGDCVGYGRESYAVNPRRDWNSRTSVANMIGRLIIDPDVVNKSEQRYRIFQKAIQTAFDLWENKSMYANMICRQVANTVGYDFFEDPKGNLVFQAPKYDKLPRIKGDRQHEGGDTYTDDYSRIPYHARDYIIDDIGEKTRRYIDTETGLVTFVTSHSAPDWINYGDYVSLMSLTGMTTYERMKKLDPEIADRIIALNRRYGVRRQELKPIVTGALNGDTAMLDRWALANLNKINANVKSGILSMNQRPDLWPGRTVFLVEDQKLAYITDVTNTLNKSAVQAHNTQITLAYIHHPSEKIGVPWHLATAKDVDVYLPPMLQDIVNPIF